MFTSFFVLTEVITAGTRMTRSGVLRPTIPGKGAKYTRSRRPCTLVYTERFGTKHEAMSREYYLKKLSHREREALVKTGLPGAGSTVRN